MEFTTINKNINISTLVYMLETNIKIDPNKLDELYEKIEPISYDNPINGIISDINIAALKVGKT